jgi:peptidoglycan/LPS O-acetylase OafA/YrhL
MSANPREDNSGSSRERRQRFGLVLAFITASFFVEGTVSRSGWYQAIVTALLGATLLLAFWAGNMPPRRLRRAGVVVAVGVAAAIVAVATGDHTAQGFGRLANAALVALAPPAIAVGVVRSLRKHGAVTVEAVLGALCLYLLAGMFFAFVYSAVNDLGGDPFFANGVEATPARCVYFSFTTLTTVGYGDLTARSDLGHTLAVTEALLGQLYLVTVVSVGVANLVPRRRFGEGS